MKKKLAQALVSYFIDEYNKKMERKYKLASISKEQFLQLMSKAESVTICYQNYCCYGMYNMCWFDEYASGIWYMTEDEVREMAISVFEGRIDELDTDRRIVACEDEYGTHILLIGRDVKKYKMDTFIDFWRGGMQHNKVFI